MCIEGDGRDISKQLSIKLAGFDEEGLDPCKDSGIWMVSEFVTESLVE